MADVADPNGALPVDLVGRTAEIELIGRLLDRALDGQPTSMFIDGETGIGKTRLLDEVAVLVRSRGGMAVRGEAPPTSGDPMPFAVLTNLLRDVLRQLSVEQREATIQRAPGLGNVLPSWRLDSTVSPPPTSSVALSEQVLDTLDSLARDRTMLAVIVDDLQWCDSISLDILAVLARAAREACVFLVLAARLEDVATDSPLLRMRSELLRIGTNSLTVGPLEAETAAELLERLVKRDVPGRRRTEITTLARGNPLFLRELVDVDDRRGPDEPLSLPESLVALTQARLSRLTESQIAVLQVVATVGEGCTEDVVIQVLAQPDAATIADLHLLVGRHLLTRGPDGSIRSGYPVLREVVLRDVLQSQVGRMQAAVARAVAADPNLIPESEFARLVRLANLWHGAGDRTRALPALARAAEAAEGSFAFGTAFNLYSKALRIMESGLPAAKRRIGFQPPTAGDSLADLRLRAADSAILAGYPDTAIEWLDQALPGVADRHDRDRVLFTRARAMLALGDAHGAVSTYRRVRNHDHGGETSGSASIGFARALIAAGEVDEAVVVAASALTAARTGRARNEEETALLVLGTALTRSGKVVDGLERLLEARALRRRTVRHSSLRPRISRVMDLTAGLNDAAVAARSAGFREEGERLAADAVGAAARWGAEGEAARHRISAADSAIVHGHWDDALAMLDDCVDHPSSAVAALARRARLAALRGADDRAASDLARCESSLPRARSDDRAAFSMALVALRSSRRQTEEATAAAMEGLVMARDAPSRDRLELLAMAVRSHVDAALAARAVRSGVEGRGHEEIARALADEAANRAVRDDPDEGALAATTAAELARLGTSAVEAWSEARNAWQGAGAVWWLAYAAFREGEARLASPGKRDAARESLRTSRGLAQRLEAAPLVAEIDSLAARGRIEFAGPGAAEIKASVIRKLPISDRELEVLLLIAKGLTNKEIASELFISDRTAAHHVGHIFDKLGVSSRVEAANVAHHAGVLVEGA